MISHNGHTTYMRMNVSQLDEIVSRYAYIVPLVWLVLYVGQAVYYLPNYHLIAQSAAVSLFAFFAIVYACPWWTVRKLQNTSPQNGQRVSNFRVYAYMLSLLVLDVAALGAILNLETFE